MLASVYSSVLQGLESVMSAVASSGAMASTTIERSAWAFLEPRIVLMVNATSAAVSAWPSENVASSRILNVQVSLSGEHDQSVARSLVKFMSSSVTMRVDWIRGSCTCSPQPQSTQGSNPASGSFSALIAIVT